MKPSRTLFALALLFAACSLSTRAQQPPAPAQNTRPSLEGKVAVIDTSAFMDDKAGIRRVVAAMSQIEAEFKPQSDELQRMRAHYDDLVKQINAGTGDPATLRRASDEADQLKVTIDRKADDAKAAYQKRVSALMGPIQEDVSRALDAYAKQYGIALIIDISQVPLIVPDGAKVDITDHFISIYNQGHPATAAAPAPTATAPAGTRPAPSTTPATRRP